MNRQFTLSLFLALALANPTTSSAADCTAALPWKQLLYEQKSLWLTARSDITLTTFCGGEARKRLQQMGVDGSEQRSLWQLRASSSVASNTEELTLLLRPFDGAAIYKQRLSRGRDQRMKSYRYDSGSILRQRRDPAAGEQELSPQDWSNQRQKTLHLKGQRAAARPLTGAHALLQLVSEPALREAGAKRSVYVHTDHNIYQVRLLNEGPETLESRARVNGPSLQPAQRQVYRVSVSAVPVGQNPDKADFNLLGLTGEISILLDADLGLPLLVSGQAPRVGAAEVRLVAAEL